MSNRISTNWWRFLRLNPQLWQTRPPGGVYRMVGELSDYKWYGNPWLESITLLVRFAYSFCRFKNRKDASEPSQGYYFVPINISMLVFHRRSWQGITHFFNFRFSYNVFIFMYYFISFSCICRVRVDTSIVLNTHTMYRV